MGDSPDISVVDFISVATNDLERSVKFYGETLGLRNSVHMPERGYAEFETDNVTISVMNFETVGLEFHPNHNGFAMRVPDVAAARETLESRGVQFHGPIMDTGVCYISPFSDPDGNTLLLHHRYAPRIPEHD